MKAVSVICVFSVLLILTRGGSSLSPNHQVETKSFQNEISGNSYHFAYELTDGQSRDESGKLETTGDVSILKVNGFYTFEGTNGKTYRVIYTADENGYRPIVTESLAGSIDLDPNDRIDPTIIKTLLGGGR